MPIVGFSRIDTVTVPDKFMAIVRVSESGEGVDTDGILSVLEKDKSDLDYLGIIGEEDPLDIPDLYRLIKSVKPRGLKVLIVTRGESPTNLDDLIGAGYAHAADILIGKEVTGDQMRCIELLKDNGCKYAVTLRPGEHDENSVRKIAELVDGCSMFIFRQDRDKPLSRSEMSPLIAAAKTCTWNVKTV